MLVEQAKTFFQKGQYDSAIQYCNEIIIAYPQSELAYHSRGAAYNAKGDIERAFKDYNKAIELNPNYAPAYINRGIIYANKGDFEQAFNDYNKAIELSPNDASAYYNRGLGYLHKGSYEQAIHDFRKAIELRPNHAFSYYNRGLAFHAKGDFDHAILDYNKSIELLPNYTRTYMNRGLVFHAKGDYEQAIQDYSTAQKMDPLNGYILLNSLPCFIRLNRFSEAAKLYEKFQSTKEKEFLEDPAWEFYKHYFTAATQHVKEGHYRQALRQLNTAEEKFNNTTGENNIIVKRAYSDILALKGYVLEKLNITTEAINSYRQALLLYADQPDVHQRLNILRN